MAVLNELRAVTVKKAREKMAKIMAQAVSPQGPSSGFKAVGLSFFKVGEGGYIGAPAEPSPLSSFPPRDPDPTRIQLEAEDSIIQVIGTGDGSTANFVDTLTHHHPVVASTPPPMPTRITFTITTKKESDSSTMTVTDDGNGNLIGDGSGTINYTSGVVNVTFEANVKNGESVTVSYRTLQVWPDDFVGAVDIPQSLDIISFEETPTGVFTVLCTFKVFATEMLANEVGEFGIFDQDGDLFAYGNFPLILKVGGQILQGSVRIIF